ncbi:MAG: [protein-PII] uridylyltransferase [Nitrospirae bacterium]|nr:[protein-PII] uridylyltransferase [Candidatus Manganitrophaceae bacterium]
MDPSPNILNDLRSHFLEKQKEIRAFHNQGGAGLRVVEALSDLADHLLLRGFQTINPTLVQEWGGAMVPIGGYGRRELSPASDIDLMFLFPEGRPLQAGKLASELLPFFWDLGYKIGHSVRNVEECIAAAKQDPLIATSLLESRLLTGDRALFQQFHEAFFSKVVGKNLKGFLAALNEGREAGRKEFGATPYLLEPNLKQSPGGLRDIHHLRWVALARYRTNSLAQLFQWGLLSNAEYSSLTTALDFLWRIRNQLHFQAGKASDHLTMELQEELAPFFHFENRRDLMRQYYILTGWVIEISDRFIRDAFPASRWNKWRRTWQTRQVAPGFQLVSEEIVPQAENLFQFFAKDENLFQIFLLAKEHHARIPGPILEVLHQVAEQERDRPVSPEGAQRFRSILARPGGIADTLRLMHRTHVLWRIIPEFGRINRLVQESRSHFFTVDEHSFRAVEEAERLAAESGPIGKIYAGIQRKDLLHLGLLLHDVGKGRPEDHSEIGATIAEAVGTQLGYTEDDRSLLIFLVRRHLILSEVALYRDFSNEPILLQFAKEVARPETLKKLFILTCADIRAVGPGTWTTWKGELLLKLYQEAISILAGEASDPEDQKTAAILTRLRQEAKGKYPEVWLEETLAALTPRYLLATPFEKVLVDLSAFFHLLIDPIHVGARPLPELGMTEYTLYTYDQITPGLFSKMTGVLAAKGLQIMAAQVFTQTNGFVVDTFQVIDPDYTGAVPPERVETISQEVRNVLTGKETIAKLFARGERFRLQKSRPPAVSVRVELDNDSSHHFTIIDIFAPDRRGLLYAIAKTLFDLELSVHSAKIATRLDQIVDVFYVQGPDHGKITDPEQIHAVKEQLTLEIEQVFSIKEGK